MGSRAWGMLLLVISLPAFANDYMAAIGKGGIEVARTEAVSMESEELTISENKVEVAYVFKNLTDKDVTVDVAFPIPDYKFSIEDVGPRFVDFTAEVDGKPVKFERAVRAVVGDKDYAPRLRALGIKVENPTDAAAQLEKLPREVLEGLARDGLVDPGEGRGWPLWTAEVNFHWKQKFKARAVTRVRHSYTPHTGGAAWFTSEERGMSACVDDATYKKVVEAQCPKAVGDDEKARNCLATSGGANWLVYELSTGASWAGPIKKFHLTVKKRNEREIVSTCFKGLKRTSPTTLEVRLTDFEPREDLVLFFY